MYGRYPDKDPVIPFITIPVLVTDGENVGTGWYDFDEKEWTYTLAGKCEQTNNKIKAWKPLPELRGGEWQEL